MKRILVVQCDTVLASGLMQFLSSFDNLIVETFPAGNLHKLTCRIQEAPPNVLIITEECLSPEMLEELPLQMLENVAGMRSLIINHRNNTISVHDSYRVELHEVSDFLAIL